MDYVGKINEEGGTVYDLPIEVRRVIYDFIKCIDLDEDDRHRAEGSYHGHVSEEFPGLNAVVSDERITILLQMGVYDEEKQRVDGEKVLAVGVPRNDIEGLLDDVPEQYH